jgi:hypothetical protein
LSFFVKDGLAFFIFTIFNNFYQEFIFFYTFVQYLFMLNLYEIVLTIFFLFREVTMSFSWVKMVDFLVLRIANRAIASGWLGVTEKIVSFIRISLEFWSYLQLLLFLNLKESIDDLGSHFLIILHFILHYSTLFHVA